MRWTRIRNLKRCCLLFFLLVVLSEYSSAVTNINQLEGKAGFRTASLKWKYPANARLPISFKVRYCERHTWGLHRCRDETIDETVARKGRKERDESNEIFVIDIGGLRMATNYTFQVIPQDGAIPKHAGRPTQISLQTKGFSAKATKCLADSSEVSVETGPYFGGRISVEDSTKPGCFVKGDMNSSQTKYNLRIRHHDCGSIVNGSKVTTVILVQENVPILTHSTRRFVVVCSFSPESFIVQAGVSLPRETSVAKSLDFSRIIRLAPQTNNLLNPADSAAASALQQDQLKNELDTKHSFLTSSEAATGRGMGSSGTWNFSGGAEMMIVLGMVCVAVVASIGSLVWFIKSYQSPGARSDSGSSVDDSESIESPYDSHSSADNRSEYEVELDFEFSEDHNNHHSVPHSPVANQSNSSSRNTLSNETNSSYASSPSHLNQGDSCPSSISSNVSSSYA